MRLEPGQTKNGDGRMRYFMPGLRALLEAQWVTTNATATKVERIIPWVFHRHGAPIKSFRRAWLTACLESGFATLISQKPRVIKRHRIFHDFRRTAVRNLERAGVSRSVAMKLTGHKTAAAYRRYAIAAPPTAASECPAVARGTALPFTGTVQAL